MHQSSAPIVRIVVRIVVHARVERDATRVDASSSRARGRHRASRDARVPAARHHRRIGRLSRRAAG